MSSGHHAIARVEARGSGGCFSLGRSQGSVLALQHGH